MYGWTFMVAKILVARGEGSRRLRRGLLLSVQCEELASAAEWLELLENYMLAGQVCPAKRGDLGCPRLEFISDLP